MNDSGKACGATFKEGSAVLTGKEYFAGYSYTCSYSVPRTAPGDAALSTKNWLV